MYDHQHDSSWRLLFAVLPGNPPVFYNVTWRRTADQNWKVANTPRWDALWKDHMNWTKERVLNICIHASDLSLLRVCTDLTWLIEFAEQWSWLPLWSPGTTARKYIQPVASGSSFPLPENTLDPNGIVASSAWDAPTRPPSSVNRQPVQQVPVRLHSAIFQ